VLILSIGVMLPVIMICGVMLVVESRFTILILPVGMFRLIKAILLMLTIAPGMGSKNKKLALTVTMPHGNCQLVTMNSPFDLAGRRVKIAAIR
jgi:hypothetical protein